MENPINTLGHGQLDLCLFDGAAAPAAAAAAPESASPETTASNPRAARNPLASVKYGKQEVKEAHMDPAGAEGPAGEAGDKTEKEPEVQVTADTLEKRRADFENLIKGEYRDQFAERTQRIIDERFKQTKTLESKMNALSPVTELLAAKYGVKADDTEGLVRAIEQDSDLYAAEAERRGLTVEQYKEYRKLERENENLRRTTEERAQREQMDRTVARWHQEASEARRIYPTLDLAAEMQNPKTGPDFVGLLRAGIPVRTAYEVTHKDDIISGAMRYTAEQVQKKTVEDIRTRGMRPPENGGGGQAPADVKTDVSKLTKADREEIARRVARGEKIMF